MSEHRITFITAPTEVGERIATTLVEEDLAVCINIIDRLKSIYKWEGQVEQAPESLLIVKSTTDKSDSLIDRVKEIHPYEVPEVISFDVTAGNPDYLDWLSGKEIVIEDASLEDLEEEAEVSDDAEEGEIEKIEE
jgi:periplasmic divalent cation tolerance protein